jgi:hypothetical protein
VMGIVLYWVVNVVQAQNETTPIKEYHSYDISNNNQYTTPTESCILSPVTW